MVLEYLKHQLLEHPEISEVDTARTGADALAFVQRQHYGIACLDIDLPDMDGFDLSQQIAVRKPYITQLAISAHCNPDTVFRFRRSTTFSGFLDKDLSVDSELSTAIDTVLNGKIFISQKAKHLLENSWDQIRSVYIQLSRREQEIARLIAMGISDNEIMQQLNISLPTARGHRCKILRKLNLADSRELMAFALKFGMIRPRQLRGGDLNPIYDSTLRN
jgi:DNA-binding NarL/FixJ family response regulator